MCGNQIVIPIFQLEHDWLYSKTPKAAVTNKPNEAQSTAVNIYSFTQDAASLTEPNVLLVTFSPIEQERKTNRDKINRRNK